MCSGDTLTYRCRHVKYFGFDCLEFGAATHRVSKNYISVDSMCEACTVKLRSKIFWCWAVAHAKLGKQIDRGVSREKLSGKFDAVDARFWEGRKAAGLTGPMVLTKEDVKTFKEFRTM